MVIHPQERMEIERTLDELRELARSVSVQDLLSGNWLPKLVGEALEGYAQERDREYFERRYPGMSADAIMDRRVEQAKRDAAVEGAVTAGAYTAAVAAWIATGGATTMVSLPAGALAFVVDLLFTTRLQLRLAHDIAVLSGVPVDLDDVEDVRSLLRVALGERPPEGDDLDVDDGLVDVARRAVRAITRGAGDASRKAMTYVGRKVVRRALVKLTLPAAAIPLSSALNYWSLGQAAATAREVFRGRARARDLAPRVAARGACDPRLLLETLWLVVDADERTSAREHRLLEHVSETLRASPEGAEAVAVVESIGTVRTADVLRRLSASPREVRVAIFDAVREAATVDHEICRRERAVLSKIAAAAGVRIEQ